MWQLHCRERPFRSCIPKPPSHPPKPRPRELTSSTPVVTSTGPAAPTHDLRPASYLGGRAGAASHSRSRARAGRELHRPSAGAASPDQTPLAPEKPRPPTPAMPQPWRAAPTHPGEATRPPLSKVFFSCAHWEEQSAGSRWQTRGR